MAKKVAEEKEVHAPDSVWAIAKALNKSYKEEIFQPCNIITAPKKFSVGTLSADFALNGGIPLGCITTFAGPPGSCKTLCAMAACASFQREFKDKTCLYVDAEVTLPFQWEKFAGMTGVDGKRMMRMRVAGIPAEQVFKMVVEIQAKASDIGMIVFDSVKALIPQSEYENDFDKDMGMRATVAKSLNKFCRMMIGPLDLKQNVLLFINHSIVEPIPGTRAFKYSEPCGNALNYFPSLKIRFLPRKFTCGTELDLSEGKVQGDKGITPDGMVASFAITKSRVGGIDRSGGKLIFRYDTGIDRVTDLFEVVTRYNIAKLEKTTWYLPDPNTGELFSDEEGNPLAFVGKPKFLAYLQNNPEFFEEYYKAVTEYVNNTGTDISLLSEQDMAKIIKIGNKLDNDVQELSDERDEIKDAEATIEGVGDEEEENG